MWLNDGSGIFSQRASFGAENSVGIFLGDLDGDGDLDVVLAIKHEAQTVWLNGDGFLLYLPILRLP